VSGAARQVSRLCPQPHQRGYALSIAASVQSSSSCGRISRRPNGLVLTRAARRHDVIGERRRVQHLLGG
jgi:hypothetical protein